jgi:hypothetical protein
VPHTKKIIIAILGIGINSLPEMPGGRHDMAELKEFFSADDGESFYTVNLYKFHQKAQYSAGSPLNISGANAYDKFSSVMIKLLVNNDSYPVFGSTWLNLSDQGWDRIVIVRYGSRRDMAEIFADPKFSKASADKWASIEKHDRFVVKALHLPETYMLVILLIALLLTIAISIALTTKLTSRLDKKIRPSV